jgi:hypothetical protein
MSPSPSPSPLPRCGIPSSIFFIKGEWDNGERDGVRGNSLKFSIKYTEHLYDKTRDEPYPCIKRFINATPAGLVTLQ